MPSASIKTLRLFTSKGVSLLLQSFELKISLLNASNSFVCLHLFINLNMKAFALHSLLKSENLSKAISGSLPVSTNILWETFSLWHLFSWFKQLRLLVDYFSYSSISQLGSYVQ